MELKEQIKKELLENKEQERLKKVEANSKLDKIILLDNGTPYGENIKKHLDQEGIQYDLKTLKDNPDDINKASTITNLGMFPMVYLKDIYLVNQRDFQNPQQLVQAIQHFANPNFKNINSDIKSIEHLKTVQYNIWSKLNALENKLNPVLNLINKLTEEIKEEENK